MRFEFLADHPQLIPDVADWYFNTWGKGVPGNTYEKLLKRVTKEANKQSLPITRIAVDGDRPVAAAQLKANELTIFAFETHWLSGVYVDKDARGRGLATALVQEIVRIARARGIKKLYLQTEALDGGLYRRLGWEPVKTVFNMGINVLVMVRQL